MAVCWINKIRVRVKTGRQRGFYNCGGLKQQKPKHGWWGELKKDSDL